jgi:hypothetical protein
MRLEATQQSYREGRMRLKATRQTYKEGRMAEGQVTNHVGREG